MVRQRISKLKKNIFHIKKKIKKRNKILCMKKVENTKEKYKTI